MKNVDHLRPNINIFGGKKKKNPPPGGQASGWACRALVQKFRVYLSEPAWAVDFCA